MLRSNCNFITVYKNNQKKLNSFCRFASFAHKTKGPVYFYNLRKKKKAAARYLKPLSKKNYVVNKSKKSLKKKINVDFYLTKNRIRVNKRPLRDFFLNSQLSRRLSLKNYNKSLFFSFAKKRNHFLTGNFVNSAFNNKKKIEDEHNLRRSIKLKIRKRNRLFFLVFKKVMMSRKFFALLRTFNLYLFSPRFSNFNFSDNFFKLNKKVVVKKTKRGFFKTIPAFHLNKNSVVMFNKNLAFRQFVNSNSNIAVNFNLLSSFVNITPFLVSSVLFVFKYFIFSARYLSKFQNTGLKKKHSLNFRQNFIYSFNYAMSFAFKLIFTKLLHSSNLNLPFISAKHFLWVVFNSKHAVKAVNNSSNFFRYSFIRSNLVFNNNLFNAKSGYLAKNIRNDAFLESYSQILFNFLYPLLKFRKFAGPLTSNKFFINYFRNYNFKSLRAKKQTFDYFLLSSENSSAYAIYHSRKNIVNARLKIWQPLLKKLVPYDVNIYLEPLNNLLFSYKIYKSIKNKTKSMSILHNRYSVFKFLLKSVYTALVRRSFNLTEQFATSGFCTPERRKFINTNTKFLIDFLRLMLRSSTKEFSDVTSNFINTIKSLSFWQFTNLEPALLKSDSTLSYFQKKNNFLLQDSGLASNENDLLNEENFKENTGVSYIQWLHSVWNVPFLVTKGELLIAGDNKTKRLFLGLDKVPKRALVFNNFEKNNFSTYYSCNALSFYKLFTFYFSFFNADINFFNVLTRLFNKTKQVSSIRSSLLIYKKSAEFKKLNYFSSLLKSNFAFSFKSSFFLSKIWFKLSSMYNFKIAKFLFFFTLNKFFVKNAFKNNIFKQRASKKFFVNFWKTFYSINKKFRFFLSHCLSIPFSLILFPASSDFKPFFKIAKKDHILETVRKFVNSLSSRKNYIKMSLSAEKKKIFFSKRFIAEYFAKLLKIRPTASSFKNNNKIAKQSVKIKNCFLTCAAILTSFYFDRRNSYKFNIFNNLRNNTILAKPFVWFHSQISYKSVVLRDFNFAVSTKILNAIFGKKKKTLIFKNLYNIYYHKFVVARHMRFKLLSSLYSNLLESSGSRNARFSDDPLVSFPQLKIRQQRLFKFNPDAKGRDRVFYYVQKKPKFLHKSNKPFRFLKIYTPRINLSSNLLAVHGVNRHIVERNSRRSTARVARKRKYYLHHIWRKLFDCSSTTLFYKWKTINNTKRKWLTYFLQFENSLLNYVWFTRLINNKNRAVSAINSGLFYVNGNLCLNSKYSVRAGDVISLNVEAYNVLTTRRAASYLRRKIGGGSFPFNIKKKFLAKLIRLLQKDVAFGTTAAVRTTPERMFLILQAAKFLSSTTVSSSSNSNKKFAPGGAKFGFSDIPNADLSVFGVRRLFGDNAAEIAYWKTVIFNFYKKLDSSKLHNGRFYYRFKNHLYVKRYPYSPHEWFAFSKRRMTDIYNPLNIDTWISHKYWR